MALGKILAAFFFFFFSKHGNLPSQFDEGFYNLPSLMRLIHSLSRLKAIQYGNYEKILHARVDCTSSHLIGRELAVDDLYR